MSDPSFHFSPGLPFEETFLTPKGWIVIAADVRADKRTLHLDDFAVTPIHTKALQIGPPAVLALRRKLSMQAGAQGYTEVVIWGVRQSGANPNRPFTYRWRLP